MTILDSDLDLGLTKEVVHNYLMIIQANFENFWTLDSLVILV